MRIGSQPTIDSIMHNTKTLVGHCLEMLLRDVKLCLAQNGLNWTEIEGLKEVFNNQVDNYEKAVDPVSTEYLHVKYVVDNLHFVVRLLSDIQLFGILLSTSKPLNLIFSISFYNVK